MFGPYPGSLMLFHLGKIQLPKVLPKVQPKLEVN